MAAVVLVLLVHPGFLNLLILLLLISSAVHYSEYYRNDPNALYYYFNLGWSGAALWISTWAMGLAIALLFSV